MAEPQGPDNIPGQRIPGKISADRIAVVRSDYETLRPRIKRAMEPIVQQNPKLISPTRRAIFQVAAEERRDAEFMTEIQAELARIDFLTGLTNRRWFEEETQRKIAQLERTKVQKPLWLVYFDLDNFKKVNTQYGEKPGGDDVLKAAAEIPVRKEEPISRFGGEEFTQLLDEDITEESLARAMERNMTALKERSAEKLAKLEPIIPVTQEEKIEQVTMSIGLARYTPGDTVDTFIERANMAMRKAKDTGRNKIVIAEPSAPGDIGFDNGELKYRDLQSIAA